MVVPNPLLAVVVVVKPNPPNPKGFAVLVVPKPTKPLLAVLPNPPENSEPVPPVLKILDAVVFAARPNPTKQK